MFLLTIFELLIFNYSEQKQKIFTIGTPIANRNLIEIEGLIGFFVNTLILICEFNNNDYINEIRMRGCDCSKITIILIF